MLHFTARDNLRLIGQHNSTKGHAHYYRSAVNARDKTETLLIVYGHRRGLGSNVYLGATTTINVGTSAAEIRRRREIFMKLSCAFDAAA